jgi:hypothetical protein
MYEFTLILFKIASPVDQHLCNPQRGFTLTSFTRADRLPASEGKTPSLQPLAPDFDNRTG